MYGARSSVLRGSLIAPYATGEIWHARPVHPNIFANIAQPSYGGWTTDSAGHMALCSVQESVRRPAAWSAPSRSSCLATVSQPRLRPQPCPPSSRESRLLTILHQYNNSPGRRYTAVCSSVPIKISYYYFTQGMSDGVGWRNNEKARRGGADSTVLDCVLSHHVPGVINFGILSFLSCL